MDNTFIYILTENDIPVYVGKTIVPESSRRGLKLSEDTRKKMSIVKKGIKRSKETKRKISETVKAIWLKRKTVK